MPTFLPTSIVYKQHQINSPLSRKMHFLSIVNSTNMQWVAAICNVFENYPGANLRNFQYYKGRTCMFRDSRELIQCCMKTIDAGMEVGMTQFKCKPRRNIRQDFPNHFMSLWSETRKRRHSKFSALMSLAETTQKTCSSVMFLFPCFFFVYWTFF